MYNVQYEQNNNTEVWCCPADNKRYALKALLKMTIVAQKAANSRQMDLDKQMNIGQCNLYTLLLECWKYLMTVQASNREIQSCKIRQVLKAGTRVKQN